MKRRMSFLVLPALIFLLINEGFTQTAGTPAVVKLSTLAQAEPHIAVNPTDDQNLIATAITQTSSASQIGYYSSNDGGTSWSGSDDINGAGLGDPVVAFDNDGIAYLIYQNRSVGKLFLHTSTDGGTTWSVANTAIDLDEINEDLDRPWIAISPVRNSTHNKFNIYISLTRFDLTTTPSHTQLRVYRSIDGGTNFTQWKTLDYDAANQEELHGSSIAVSENEDIFLAYAIWKRLATDQPVVKIAVNGWDSNGIAITANDFNIDQIGQYVSSGSGGGNWFIKDNKVRVDNYPRIAIDNSNGAYGDNVYVACANQGSMTSNIALIRGEKIGSNYQWTSVSTVAGGSGHQWMPAISVRADGIVGLLYSSSEEAVNQPVYTYFRYSTDGGASFSSQIEVGSSFLIEPTGGTFIGDYDGLTSGHGDFYGVWTENRDHGGTNNKRLMYFNSVDVPVQSGFVKTAVDQVDASQQSFGQFERWEQEEFRKHNAPHDFLFHVGSTEVLRAEQDFKQGTTQKFDRWLLDGLYNSSLNHRSFTTIASQPPITANFQPVAEATIQTELITSGQTNLGTIEFKDPWLIDFDEQPYGLRNRGDSAAFVPFATLPGQLITSSNNKGVFLNQDPATAPVFYSVAAPTTPIGGIDYFLSRWTGTNVDFTDEFSATTSLEFLANNATITAQLKGHKASGISTATVSNNSRKMVRDQSNKWHMVYIDNNSIYYSKSASGSDGDWDNETLLEEGTASYPCRNPSIDFVASTPTNDIYVVYEKLINYQGTNIHEVRFRKYDSQTSQWLASEAVSGFGFQPISQGKPTLHSNTSATNAWVVWKSSANLVLRMRGSSGQWGNIFVIPGNTSSAANPSISRTSSGIDKTKLVWAQDGDIWFIEGDASGSSWNWATTAGQNLTSGFTGVNSANYPSISIDNAQIHIAFEGKSNYFNPVYYYDKNAGVLTQLSANFTSLERPSIAHRSTTGDLAMAYYESFQNKIYYSTNTSGSWTNPLANGGYTGRYPSLNDDNDRINMVSTRNTSVPYLITASQVLGYIPKQEAGIKQSKQDKISSEEDVSYFRRADIDLAGISIDGTSELLNGTLVLDFHPDSSQMEFVKGNDRIRSFLNSSPFTAGTRPLDIHFDISVHDFQKTGVVPIAWNSENIFEINLVDINDPANLVAIKALSIAEIIDLGESGDTLAIDLSTSISRFAGKEVEIRTRFKSVNRTTHVRWTDVYHSSDEKIEEKSFAKGEEGEATETLPTEYWLAQNFPNPFNPITTIEFGLPESQLVELTIYNIDGQRVITLLSEVREAGKHSIRWNGRNAAGNKVGSGVYLYSLKAGAVQINKKMLLAK